MSIAKLNFIQFDFFLYNQESVAFKSLPVSIQYFDVVLNKWLVVYNNTITDGRLFIEEKASSRSKAVLPFIEKLKLNIIPDVRIVAQKTMYNLSKQEVLSKTYGVSFNKKTLSLVFDFGTAFLLPAELLKTLKGYNDFVVVSSFLPYSKPIITQSQLTDLKSTISKTQDVSTKLEKDLYVAYQEVEVAKEQNQSIQETLKNQILENESLKVSIASKDNLIKEATEMLSKQIQVNESYQLELAKLTEINTSFEEKINVLASENTQLNSNLTTNKITVSTLEKENKLYGETLQAKDDKISVLEKEILTNKETERALTSRNTMLEDKITELSKDISFDTRPMPLQSVYSNIVQEIDIADVSNSSNFKLANLSVKLKTMVNRDDKGMNLQFFNLDNVDKVNGNTISEVVFDIAPTRTVQTQAGKMPSLLGYTETAVRRILQNLGFRV